MFNKGRGEHLWTYLKQNKSFIGIYILNQFFFISTWILYHPKELKFTLYPLAVTSILGIVFCGMGYRRYYKKIRQMERVYAYIQANENGPEVFNIEVEKYEEEKLLEIAHELILKLKTAEENHAIKNADRESYYALWSHQIKTPITALKLLLENFENSDDIEVKRYQMFEEILKIEQYMEMVLHYNRIGDMSNDMVIEEVELQKTVHQVLKKFSILFINRRLNISVEVPETKIISDKKWLVLVIEQILSNAIKYTESGSIKIYGCQEYGVVQLIIEDTGIGIRAEDLERVFEKGFTGYNGRLDQRASGIGLYLVKKAMDHLKHKITIESQVGEGTKVTILFRNLTKV